MTYLVLLLLFVTPKGEPKACKAMAACDANGHCEATLATKCAGLTKEACLTAQAWAGSNVAPVLGCDNHPEPRRFVIEVKP